MSDERLNRTGIRRAHDPEYAEQYAGLVVVPDNREVYATGRNGMEAMENARTRAGELQQSLPLQSELLILSMPAPPMVDPTCTE